LTKIGSRVNLCAIVKQLIALEASQQKNQYMQIEEFNNEMPWMTEKVKNEIQNREKIVKDEDIDSLFLISGSDFFSIVLHSILCNRCNNKPEILNPTQRVLFLCMHLENAGQADSILAFLQEWYPEFTDEVVYALNEISATKSAEIIKQAVELLPKNGSWFFNTADESAINLMVRLDREFSSYPDGFLCDLYRKYAEKHRSDF
jgi:hypothetical protein